MRRYWIAILSLTLFASPASAVDGTVVKSMDLSQPFGAHSAWRFMAAQGPEVSDPPSGAEDKAPGTIHLCISADNGQSCRPDLNRLLAPSGEADVFSDPHYLDDARIVRFRGDDRLLLLRVASLHSANGDQRTATVALAYDRGKDAFAPVYEKQTGRNNNQEIRYVIDGPLQGAIISAEPTDDAPYAFWITINKREPDRRYQQVLRFRSATAYGDGNPLAVIDSEMPNIQKRLGLWHPGLPMPLPAGSCARPHLLHNALWC
ncbi:MAG: hypothetical protein J0I79_03030 [Mesorhizobium sp.]|uniref:hypothetical protein n=1 Tax=Mesorhizobium sp. TaxID=1871066 RepID=UPI001ACFE488|nr:hypothetical protein [Mesorhizobium sp.]MBN9216906.1 hypothetical protein [Mesorhizobium sp.]